MESDQRARAPRAFDALLGLATVVLAFLLGSFAAGGAGNPDLWYQLAAGRLVVSGEFPFGLDPFSLHEPAPPWIHHAWLFDVLIYGIYRSLGGAALVAIKAGFVALMAFVLLRTRERKTDGLWPAIATVLALLSMSPRLGLQPSIASYLLFALLQLALTRPARAKRWQLPVFAGILFALWVNLDGGFWLGLILIAIRLVGATLDRFVPLGDADIVESSPGAGDLALVLGAAIVGCLINPYLVGALLAVPTEFAMLRVAPESRGEWMYRNFYRLPYSAEYIRDAGIVSVVAYGLLLGCGIIMFFFNAAGWRWGRVLAWFAFTGASVFYPRIVPYAAIVAGPALAMSVQSAWSRWLANRREKMTTEGKHVLAFAGSFGRFVPLLAIGVLLFMAWPGWLAGDPGGTKGLRRVAWVVEPEATHERMAKQFAAWYADGRLRPGDARGFNFNPEFGYYCAWFCPPQKSFFDLRLTAPPDVWADYSKAHKGILNLRGGGEPGDAPPEPILEKYRLNCFTGSGEAILERGLARIMMSQPNRWPLWAVSGHGAIFGFHSAPGPDPMAYLHADPVALALNPSEKLPTPHIGGPPQVPSFWDTYLAGTPPIPPETHESALWLVAHDADQARFFPTTMLWQTAAAIGLSAPIGPGTAIKPFEPFSFAWMTTQAGGALGTFDAWRRFTPDGRKSRAEALLALRAARRSIAVSPDDYEGYLRAMRAYMAFDSDGSFVQPQQLVAARQVLARIPLAEAAGQEVAPDAIGIHEALLEIYQKTPILPNAQVPAIDLIAESLQARVDLGRGLAARRGAAPDSVPKQWVEMADKVREEVQKRIVDYENAAGKAPPSRRAVVAVSRGLAREAIKVLHEADPKDVEPAIAEIMTGVLLLAGEGEEAFALANSALLRGSPGAIEQRVKAAAALGDYDAGMAALDETLAASADSLGRPLAWLLQSMHFPDAPPYGLTRVMTMPSWGGTKVAPDRMYSGDFVAVALGAQHRFNLQAQIGMLALEQGDMTKARERLRAAVRPVGPPVSFPWRPPALRWLELLDPKPVRAAPE
ncbi:MAG: hypothetical protein U0746_04710 [Gemmataceae bacterium]